METKSVLLVDAFADEPLAGVPVPVVPAQASRTQLRAIATEFGASGAVTADENEVRYVERERATAVVEAAVAAWAGLQEGDLLEEREFLSVVERDGSEHEYPVEHDDSGAVRVELPEQDIEPVSVSLDRLAPALGTTVEAIQSVGTELPVSKSTEFGGTLFVPIGFLEALSNCSPDRETLTALLEQVGARSVCAFTFDTLARRSDLHARVFDPSTTACERPASGVAFAACGQHLRAHDAFDGDIDTVRVECGHFLDRPGTVETTVDAPYRVGGRGLTVLDTTITVPADPDDDIIEV